MGEFAETWSPLTERLFRVKGAATMKLYMKAFILLVLLAEPQMQATAAAGQLGSLAAQTPSGIVQPDIASLQGQLDGLKQRLADLKAKQLHGAVQGLSQARFEQACDSGGNANYASAGTYWLCQEGSITDEQGNAIEVGGKFDGNGMTT